MYKYLQQNANYENKTMEHKLHTKKLQQNANNTAKKCKL